MHLKSGCLLKTLFREYLDASIFKYDGADMDEIYRICEWCFSVWLDKRFAKFHAWRLALENLLNFDITYVNPEWRYPSKIRSAMLLPNLAAFNSEDGEDW